MPRTCIMAALTFLTLGPALAQPAPPPEAPSAAAAPARGADPEAQRVLTLLSGSFAAAATPQGGPGLAWNSAPVSVAGLPGAVYFEIAEAGGVAQPRRQGIMHVYRATGSGGGGDGGSGGELRLRIFRFIGEPTLPAAVVGLWAAPDLFPAIAASTLDPQADLVLHPAPGGGYAGATVHPGLTVESGAVECAFEVALAPNSVAFAERGFDAGGTQVWGQAPGTLTRFGAVAPPAVVRRLPSGLVTIDLGPPADSGGPALVEGGTIQVHYTGWRTDGVMLETSRQERRQPLLTRVPGTGLKGVDEALLGLAAGMRRRAVIPPDLAFGEKGSLRGRIPPNATLLYEFEPLEVRNPVPGQPPPPLPPGRREDE